MLPRSTSVRNSRDISKLKLNGRSQEIQRLIGRALRSVVNLKLLGEREIIIDCDVIQADGGTRTASITGGFVALVDACKKLVDDGVIEKIPLSDFLAAVSVGLVEDKEMLDLCYEEIQLLIRTLNVVMTIKRRVYLRFRLRESRHPFKKSSLKGFWIWHKKGIKPIDRNTEGMFLGQVSNEVGELQRMKKVV